MTLVLVPHCAERDRVNIWAAVSGTAHRPADLHLTTEQGQSATGPAEAWVAVDAGGALASHLRTFWTQTVELRGLSPGRRVRVRGVASAESADCYAGTLPARLPDVTEPPFVVLLGSCFASFRDNVGAVGACVESLPAEHRPHIKLLCGDQVYLDNPWNEILPRSKSGLAERFLGKYLDTWVPRGGRPALSRLLAHGSTYFLADDHEFWNNHPNRSPLIATRGPQGREAWRAVAEALYRSFQTMPGQDPTQTQAFSLGPLEVRIVDTRFGRQAGDRQFMDPAAHSELLAWLRRDTAPGVLVLGAPIFTEKAGWFASRVLDRSLANYAQYGALADAILASKRSLLVLTGDVHFGRAAASKADTAHRAGLFEIAASPLALVNDAVGGKFEPAPDKFPADAEDDAWRRLPPSPVTTLKWDDWQGKELGLTCDHFITLGFHALGRGALVHATAWTIHKSGRAVRVGSLKLKLQEGL